MSSPTRLHKKYRKRIGFHMISSPCRDCSPCHDCRITKQPYSLAPNASTPLFQHPRSPAETPRKVLPRHVIVTLCACIVLKLLLQRLAWCRSHSIATGSARSCSTTSKEVRVQKPHDYNKPSHTLSDYKPSQVCLNPPGVVHPPGGHAPLPPPRLRSATIGHVLQLEL